MRVAIHLSPRARSDRLLGVSPAPEGGRTVKASVTAPARDGQANEALLQLLARAWRLPRRDLSIVIDERLPAETVRGTIRANAPHRLEDVREFDRYQGKGIPDGHVSLSVRLTFRGADRTLTDDEVQGAVEGIIAALAREHGARLR